MNVTFIEALREAHEKADDAALIAILRNAVPDLIAALEAARTARDAPNSTYTAKPLNDLYAALNALDAKVMEP